ncbi:MAG: hypothetical protein HQL75_05395 [Magnetococcales bacterium]|nr:hypothetical protein [Magnetococcales bacterium]
MSQYPLRLPDSLMKAVRKTAKEDNASMNQFFVSAIAEKMSAIETENLLKERAKRADLKKYFQVLDEVPDAPPIHGDDRID